MELSSGAFVFIGEEQNEESRGDEEWDQQDDSHKDVPPGDSVTHEAVEDLDVQAEVQSHGEESDQDNSTLDWEASEAAEVSSLLVRAIAEAAATVASVSDVFSILLVGHWVRDEGGLILIWLDIVITTFVEERLALLPLPNLVVRLLVTHINLL